MKNEKIKKIFKKILMFVPIFLLLVLSIFGSFTFSKDLSSVAYKTDEHKTLEATNLTRKEANDTESDFVYNIVQTETDILIATDYAFGDFTGKSNVMYFDYDLTVTNIVTPNGHVTESVEIMYYFYEINLVNGTIYNHDSQTFTFIDDIGFLIGAYSFDINFVLDNSGTDSWFHLTLYFEYYEYNDLETMHVYEQSFIPFVNTLNWSNATTQVFYHNSSMDFHFLITASGIDSFVVGYDTGKVEGYTEGYTNGRAYGYQQAQEAYEQTDSYFERIWDIMTNAISSALSILSIEIMPGVPLSICIIVPIIFGIIFIIWKGGAQ